jgi:hypothetical protein
MNETQILQAQYSNICQLNYPIAKGYWGYPAKRREYPTACFGVHARDYGLKYCILMEADGFVAFRKEGLLTPPKTLVAANPSAPGERLKV